MFAFVISLALDRAVEPEYSVRFPFLGSPPILKGDIVFPESVALRDDSEGCLDVVRSGWDDNLRGPYLCALYGIIT